MNTRARLIWDRISDQDQDSFKSYLSYLGPAKYLFSTQSAPPELDLEQLTNRFLAVLDQIHNVAPNAKVYLVEYLSILNADTKPGANVPLTADQIRHHRSVASLLAQAYTNAAKARSWAILVPVADESRKHALGSEVPWMNGFTIAAMLWSGAAPYHPNLAGHTAVAEMLYERVTGGDQ